MEIQTKQLRWICLGLLVYALWLAYGLYRQNTKLRGLDSTKTLGMAHDLRELIDDLEKGMAKRLEYNVELPSNPTSLARVLPASYLTGDKEMKEQKTKMRLSCTVVAGDQYQAVIKYQGRSHVMALGDSLAGKRVVRISAKEVILMESGREIHLINEPAPPEEFAPNSGTSTSDIQL